MKKKKEIIFLLLSITLLCGCLGKDKTCKPVTKELYVTRIIVEGTPYNETEEKILRDFELEDKYEIKNLNYSIIDSGSQLIRYAVGNRSSKWIDYGKSRQRITAKIYIVVKNTDLMEGNFSVEWAYRVRNTTIKKRQEVHLKQNESHKFTLKYNVTRGDPLDYSYSIAPVGFIKVPVIKTTKTKKQKLVEKIRYVKKTVTQLENQTITVCS